MANGQADGRRHKTPLPPAGTVHRDGWQQAKRAEGQLTQPQATPWPEGGTGFEASGYSPAGEIMWVAAFGESVRSGNRRAKVLFYGALIFAAASVLVTALAMVVNGHP
jgi:hypothetical protein